MKRKTNSNNNCLKHSKRSKNQKCANDNEASTSTNIHFVTNQFEELNTDIITGVRNRFIQLCSTYNNDEGTSNPSSEGHTLSSNEESNFFTSNSLFFFSPFTKLYKIFLLTFFFLFFFNTYFLYRFK